MSFSHRRENDEKSRRGACLFQKRIYVYALFDFFDNLIFDITHFLQKCGAIGLHCAADSIIHTAPGKLFACAFAQQANIRRAGIKNRLIALRLRAQRCRLLFRFPFGVIICNLCRSMPV